MTLISEMATLIVGCVTFFCLSLATMPPTGAMLFSLFGLATTTISWLLLGLTTVWAPVVFVVLYAISLVAHARYLRDHLILRSAPMSVYTVIVLGSGGHTKEMLYMLSDGFRADPRSHRRYIVSSGDRLSLAHLQEWESTTAGTYVDTNSGADTGTFDVVTVPRARYVHQSLLTTPFTAALSLLMIMPAILDRPKNRPDLNLPDIIVTNGPATGFFTVLAAYCMRVMGLTPPDKLRGLYVESWARISSLSLTGKLFRATGIADRMVVQHDDVAEKYGLENAGWLVMPERGE